MIGIEAASVLVSGGGHHFRFLRSSEALFFSAIQGIIGFSCGRVFPRTVLFVNLGKRIDAGQCVSVGADSALFDQ